MDDASARPAGAFVPRPVAYVRDLLLGFAPSWLLCGGWAADAWLGRQTRDHFDVDIAVFHHDQSAIFQHFPDWALVGHDPNVPDETTEPWNGRHLDLPAHIHFPERGSPLATSTTANHTAFEFEALITTARLSTNPNDFAPDRDARPTRTADLRSLRRQPQRPR